jgi:single-strand DNA-binding protein
MQVNSLNRVILIGRVGSDPELKFGKSGTAICSLSVATNEKFKEGKEKTEWHKVTFFGDRAERAAEWISKGQLVNIEGKLSYGSYEKDDVKHYTTDIIVDNWTTLSKGEKKESEDTSTEEDDSLPF